MNRFREKMAKFMQGRYGIDDFGRFLSGALLILILLSVLFRSAILNWLVLAGLVYCYYRMFSRNISRRYGENQKFLNLKRKFFAKKNQGFGRSGDPTKRVFKCPTCGQKVRVPKGKGKISIHCPKCSTDFIKRS
ncbi:MAG: hypothetical protein KH828_14185 [Clostridiales bacterium]|nr:hypothetical protein [Clostridiales bacterium]